MATSRTPNALLGKPATADRNWDLPLNANADFLDGIASIGRLLVTPAELPSATLGVRVTAGTYLGADGSVKDFPGVEAYALPASSTYRLWLNDTGVLSASAAFPSTPHLRLAKVVTGPASVVSTLDERVTLATAAGGGTTSQVLSAPHVFPGDVSSPTLTTDSSGPAIGFFGAVPKTQAPGLAPLVDLTTGAVSDKVVGVGQTYAQDLIDDNFAALAAKVNALTAALKRHGLMAS